MFTLSAPILNRRTCRFPGSFIFLHAHITSGFRNGGGTIRILIIIPTWDRDELLDRLESALLRQMRYGVDAVIIGRFGERRSKKFSASGGALEYVRSGLSLVDSLELGLGMAADGQYDWAVIFDDDVIPDEGYIYNFIRYHEDGLFEGACCVGGSAPDPRFHFRTGPRPVPSVHWDGTVSGDYRKFSAPRRTEVGHLQGCNWAINIGLMKAHGIHFDAGLSRVAFRLETDFQVRLARNGYKIYWFPGLGITHLNYTKGSFADFERDNYWRGHDHALYAIKNFGLLPGLCGILLTGCHPKPAWLGVPASLLGRSDYLSFYAGFVDYALGMVRPPAHQAGPPGAGPNKI